MKEVRALNKNDYNSLAVFLEKQTSKIFTSDFWLDRFDLWWDKNPAVSGDFSRGWILCEKENIKGFFGSIPVKYKVNATETLFYSATSWYVSDDCRSLSLELIGQFLGQKGPFLDATPAPNVAHIITKLNFYEFSPPWIKKDAFYIFDFNKFAQLLATRVNKPLVKSAVKTAGRVGEMLKIPFQIDCFYGNKGFYNIKEIKSFDKRFDALWEGISGKYGILALRNAKTLNWFFFGTPALRLTRRIFEVTKGNELVGYFAFKIVKRVIDDGLILSLELIDTIMADESLCAYITAVKTILQLAKEQQEKISFIQMNPFNATLDECFKKLGFFTVKGRAKLFYSGLDSLAANNNFYATALDGDRCFFP
jgi:hypothetical protein